MHGTFESIKGAQKRRADVKDRGMRSYRITCEDLGIRGQGFSCHATSMKSALAEFMRAADHDEAWPIALGGKTVVVEIAGIGKLWRGTVSGTFIPRYWYEIKEAAE
jgi:hypothetical protein